MQPTNNSKKRVDYAGLGIALGSGIGVAIGTATGTTAWLAPLCMALGVIIGLQLNKRAGRNS